MNSTPTRARGCGTLQVNISRTRLRNVWGRLMTISFLLSVATNPMLFWATPVVEASSHHAKVLEFPLPTGSIPKTLAFPLYEQGPGQYFSAGLGKEERSLTYPPFPLKLIFVQGERSFLAGVSVQIAREDGTQVLKIPGEDVEGPWLFIKIPSGTYVVSGTDSSGATIKKTISVQTEKTTVVHFRFP
ncbi:MAG: hypothetical protein WD425_10780 [Nitrospirales bacterium]